MMEMNSMDKNIISIIQLLENKYGIKTDMEWERKRHSNFQILIGTILSARTKDENTDKASEQLFTRYPTAKKLSEAKISDIKKLIRPAGFYNVKAKRIKDTSKIILKKYCGKVPDNIDELVKLPGVGYKVAACVMVYGFKFPDIPVDVHVAKVSKRIGLIKEKNPDKIRLELMRKIPRKYWIIINGLFVKHGKSICLSRKPICDICPINNLCNYYHDVFLTR